MTSRAPILVLGATGTVGSALVHRLAGYGVAIRAAARHPAPADSPLIEPCRLDLRDWRACARALEGVARLFLLTPLEEDMAAVAARLLDQAVAAGVAYVVRLSALGAGSPPLTRLGALHRETEQVLEETGIAFASLRPNAFMQNFVTQLGAGIRGQDAFHGCQGEGRVSLVDARDIADIAASLLARDEDIVGAFDLTGPEALSNHEAAMVLSRVLGRAIEYVDDSARTLRASLLDVGVSPWLLDIVMELYALSAAGGAARVSADTARLLGRPPTGFEAFVGDHAGALSPGR